MHGRVFIEEGQEHHDAFDDRRFYLRIEASPRVVEPALNRFKAMTSVRTNGSRTCADVERNIMAGEIRFELRIIWMRDMRFAERSPQSPWCLAHLTLVALPRDRKHVRRAIELGF